MDTFKKATTETLNSSQKCIKMSWTMNIREIKLALSIVWLVVSLIILMTLITPFILSDDTIFALSPKCEWKTKYNKVCPLCGMTRSFIFISQGKFSQAVMRNKFSIYLYFIFILNEIVISFFLANKIKRGGYYDRVIIRLLRKLSNKKH